MLMMSLLPGSYRFSGGPIPSRGFVLGRGRALFRVVRLGGHKVRKVRDNVSDVVDGAGVFLYRHSSIAPSLDLRRRLKAVMGVLDAMIRSGVSFARSVELTAQWDKILVVGPCYLVTNDDLGVVCGWVLVSFIMLLLFIAVSVILSILLLFNVGMMLFVGGGIGIGRIL